MIWSVAKNRGGGPTNASLCPSYQYCVGLSLAVLLGVHQGLDLWGLWVGPAVAKATSAVLVCGL